MSFLLVADNVEGKITRAEPQFIAERLRDSWGLPVVSPARQYMPEDIDGGLVWLDGAGEPRGLIAWAIDGTQAEIVTMDAFIQGAHIGGRLLDAAEADLAANGVHTITIATTNDNLRALAFYARRGYRLIRLHLDAMDRVRAMKPGVPATGNDGIPLRDMWELEKHI